jgi:hypothetical protein
MTDIEKNLHSLGWLLQWATEEGRFVEAELLKEIINSLKQLNDEEAAHGSL